MSKTFQTFNYQSIDRYRWDALVEAYAHGLPYAKSWYLDAVCEEWSVIVDVDYTCGLAFQIKKKWGLKYSLQAFLTQQLGYINATEEDIINIDAELAKQVFYKLHYHNFFNPVNLNNLRVNCILDTNKPYKELYQSYNQNTKRNLKKAEQNNLKIITKEIWDTTQTDWLLKQSKIVWNKQREQHFIKLMDNAHKHNALMVQSAWKNDSLLAMVVWIKQSGRMLYLIAASNSEGNELRANFLLVDQTIKQTENQNITIDFEGSNIEGVKRFYKGFGAKEQNYSSQSKTYVSNFFRKF
ncbi:MAG: GNAT family N-acetyltransferase [Bacteroidales bacterium]|nr:GNAT family N-acetyltransferase [Bacteroidales bacterium]